ncbi:MAG TPA: hypothetical protein VFT74_12830 [Isosphaeraceae bacterium]|nr:hypothetical protein [Isosphaeraceae bacterium]
MRAGSESVAGDDVDSFAIGTGTGYDAVYVAAAEAQSEAFREYDNPFNGASIVSFLESGSVKNKVTGPGTGNAGDPNQTIMSSEIQVDVDHMHTDKAVNYTAAPVTTNDLPVHIGNPNQETAADTNGTNLTYKVDEGGTVTYTFQASFSSTGDIEFMDGAPELTLDTSSLHVTIDGAGVVAKDANGAVVKQDLNFSTAGQSHSFTVTLTVPNVADGANIDIKYSSSLQTGHAFGSGAPVDPGTHTNATDFHWNLKVDVN